MGYQSPYLESFLSEIKAISNGQNRVRIIHPADNVSSYWLGMESDLILNGWSTIGLEFAIRNKFVTNAFYKCPLGGAAVYPVHLNTPPLNSSSQYFKRVDRLLKAIKEGSEINSRDYISADEARKAFFVGLLLDLLT